ncbi:MAG: hypothetical protein KGZ97_00895 [Bacteroidetes bacterium]|nr:hypothetical protein [Bacteroidota bacterium]
MKTQILNQKNSGSMTRSNSLFAKRILNVILSAAVIITVALFSSCQKEDPDKDSIVPERFKVEIPKSISSNTSKKTAQVDTISGNDIYEHLRNFINLGEGAAELTENVMLMIALNNLNRPLELTIVSDSDGRQKHISIIENVTFESKTYQYRMTVTDIDDVPAKMYSDYTTNIALQVFWNLAPIDGISILNSYNIDRNTDEKFMNTYYRVEYSETGSLGYDQHMVVTVTGIPLPPANEHIFGVSTVKMFAGKKGDIVSIYGNTEHPNAQFFTEQTGFNWAFVAAGSKSLDIAVAEVGLPPVTLDSDDRYTLLEEYSIYNVFRNQILLTWPTINPEVLDAYLYHAQAPGYFNQYGFVQGGEAPNSAYAPLEELIEALVPYNPTHIGALDVRFQE